MSLVFMVALLAAACGSGDQDVSTGAERVDVPLQQIDPEARSVQVLSQGSDFVVVQSDSSTGQVSASVGDGTTWSAATELPLDGVGAVSSVSDGTNSYIVATQETSTDEDSSVLGPARLAVMMLSADGERWEDVGAVTAEESAAIRGSQGVIAHAVGATEGVVTLSVRGLDDNAVEIWRVAGGRTTQEESPPAGVFNFCTNSDGQVFGLTSTIVSAGSLDPSAPAEDRDLSGSDAFYTLDGGRWTTTPYEPPPEVPYQSPSLVCSETGPMAISETVVVDGISSERRSLRSGGRALFVIPASGPGVVVWRALSQEGTQIDEIGHLDGADITFQPLETAPVIAVAVNDRGDVLAATVDPAGGGEVVWYLTRGVVPVAG